MTENTKNINTTNGLPVSNLGKWLSTAFRPLLGTQRSYLRNAVDIVNKLRKRHIDNNTILCSFDVEFVYTNCDVKKFKFILKIKYKNILNW
jgi:hypothetical protein